MVNARQPFPAISLPLDSKQDYLYVRLKSQNSISFPIELMSQAKLDQLNYKANLYIHELSSLHLFCFLDLRLFFNPIQRKDRLYKLNCHSVQLRHVLNIRYGDNFSLFWPSQPFLEKNLRELFLCLTAFFCYSFSPCSLRITSSPNGSATAYNWQKKFYLPTCLSISPYWLLSQKTPSTTGTFFTANTEPVLAIMILHASACLIYFILQEQKKRLSFVLFLFSWFLLLSSTIPNTLYSLGILEYTSIIAYGGGVNPAIDILFASPIKAKLWKRNPWKYLTPRRISLNKKRKRL